MSTIALDTAVTNKAQPLPLATRPASEAAARRYNPPALSVTPHPAWIDAMKAAVINYASALSQQLAPKGIRVNTVSPGPIFGTGTSLPAGRNTPGRHPPIEQARASSAESKRSEAASTLAGTSRGLRSMPAPWSNGSAGHDIP